MQILDLLKRGRLEDARRAIENLGNPSLPDNAELWAKYHLQVVMRTPLSGASVDAARSIPSGRAEFGTARQFIHRSIELSVEAAGGASALPTLATQIASAESSLWRGDGGHELNVLLSAARAQRCSREDEWPCVEAELGTLRSLGAAAQAEQVRASTESRLRGQAQSAQHCKPLCGPSCFDGAIERWTRWEHFTGEHSPELLRIKQERWKALRLSRRQGHRALDRCN